jgi:hypothetical protein
MQQHERSAEALCCLSHSNCIFIACLLIRTLAMRLLAIPLVLPLLRQTLVYICRPSRPTTMRIALHGRICRHAAFDLPASGRLFTCSLSRYTITGRLERA